MLYLLLLLIYDQTITDIKLQADLYFYCITYCHYYSATCIAYC